MVKYTEEQILNLILRDYVGHKIYLLAPLVRNRKDIIRNCLKQFDVRAFERPGRW